MSAARRADRDLVPEAARRALDDARGDVRAAVAALAAAVRGNRVLRDALTEPLVASACFDAVRAQVRAERKTVWRPPAAKRQADRSAGAARVVQLAAGTLLMFPLPGGKRLGEATRDEVAAAAGFYEGQSADMAVKGRWLRLVAQSVPADRTVGEVLTDGRLRELQEEARRG